MTADPIVITADEINCLIYSYFQDAGFNHSAFALQNEGRLHNSPYFRKHIPRGELIELLSKALLYHEVESHWRNDELTTNCKTGFSLLEPHVCSLETPTAKHVAIPNNAMDTNGISFHPRSPSLAAATASPLHTIPHLTGPSNNGIQIQEPSQSLANIPLPPTETLPLYDQTQALTSHSENNVKRKTSPVPIEGPAEKRARRGSNDMDIDGYYTSPVRSPVDNPNNPNDPRAGAKSTRPQGPGDSTTDPRVMLLLTAHKTEVFVCAFNPQNHNLLASGSKDAVVNLWDLPDPPPPNSELFAEPPGEPLALENVSKAAQGDLTSLHWNPQGTLLAIGSYDSVLRVCTNTGAIYFSHPQHQGPIFATRFSKDGSWLLTASLDGTTCLWDVNEKRLHKQYRCHKGGCLSLDCCLDVEWISEDTFASAGADMRIFIMRVDEDEPIKTLNGHKDEINQIRVNSSGTRLASCSDDGTAYIWKVDNLNETEDAIPGLSASDHVVILKGHTHSVSTVGWCVDHPPGTNELIATSSFDGTARLWDAVTGECLHIFRDHQRPLYALTFSPDGKFIATGSGDGWLHIYHTRSHERLWSWYAGSDKPGVFEIDWQERDGVDRLAVALECRQVAVLDLNKLNVFGSLLSPNGTS